jgi:YcaO-like protein with predicted kinase domain
MKLSSALRVDHGRCARVEDTLARLESALPGVCRYDYVEQRVCESLYWGACHVDGLGFPPMGKGDSSQTCKASTLAETAEWLALGRRRELAGYTRDAQDNLADRLPIESLLSHVSSVSAELLEQITQTELAQHWVDGYSLSAERLMKVPLEYVHGISGTNGVGAGNCLEEAIVHGAFEVLERRAVITAMRGRLVLPTIDVQTIEDPALQEQITFLENAGTRVIVKDLSFGGAMPCIGVGFINERIPAELQAHHVFKGAASHDRTTALASCLSEYAQVSQLGRRDPGAAQVYEGVLCEGEDADNFLPLFWFGYIAHDRVDFLEEGERVPFDPGQATSDCLEDIERTKAFCEQLGLEMIVVDLTDPALGFPVVQVVIPGYSDILPYHPASSPVLLEGWTRELQMGLYREEGALKSCTAAELFPEW